MLGATAHEALGRHETTPGLRATTGGSPLETLTRLWLLQTSVPRAAADRALPGLVDRLCSEGVLLASVGEVAARLDVRPYADGELDRWVVSDLTPGLDGASERMGAEHVLGVSPASLTLARIVARDPVGRGLDIGTGCGVQALRLATRCDSVVATDVNPRALRLARITMALNDVADVEVRPGSFLAPVAGERFDLVVSNPPFVISPATGERLVYRDSGVPGDRAVEALVRGVPEHLTVGGRCHLLADWMILRDRPWAERLGEMVSGLGCHAWVVQREVLDPAAYVELWLKDAGLHGSPDYADRYDTWLSWFDQQGVEAVGFGWVHLERTGSAPVVRLEEWPWQVDEALGGVFPAWTRAVAWLAETSDEAVLAATVTRVEGVVQETYGDPGAADPRSIVLRQQEGLRRARDVDTVEAAFVGACDGDLTVAQIADAIASLTDGDPDAVRAQCVTAARRLVEEGFLRAG